MARRNSGFLRAAAQSAAAAMEPTDASGLTAVPCSSPRQERPSPDNPVEDATSVRHHDEAPRREEHDNQQDGEIGESDDKQIASQRRVPRELGKVVVDPIHYVQDQSQRRAGGRLRTVDGRISADVAATFAAHCDVDLGKISQADLVEVLIRAYLSDVGVEIRRPFA